MWTWKMLMLICKKMASILCLLGPLAFLMVATRKFTTLQRWKGLTSFLPSEFYLFQQVFQVRNHTNYVCYSLQINTQTSLMEKKSDGAGNSTKLSWSWVSESMNDTLSGKGSFTDTKLLEQKAATVDVSDYLWYMTR